MIDISPQLLTVLMFTSLAIGLFLGHSLAFVLGGLSVIFGLISWGPDSLNMFMSRIFSMMNNYVLIAVPLFIFMAQMLGQSKVSDGLFDALRYVMGSLKGGIAIAVIVVSVLFAACTGIVGASVVTMGVLALPIMNRYGYDMRISSGVICSGGTLGILIPPSIMLIVMANETSISVGKLFAGAIVPGLILGGLYMLYVIVMCWINPNLGPALSAEERSKVTSSEILFKVVKSLVPPLILIVGVLGSIFAGIATPTEAAGMGAALSLILVIIYKRFNRQVLFSVVLNTTQTTSMVLMVAVGATCFTGVFVGSGCGDVVADLIQTIGMGNKWGALGIMLLITFIMGMFIDWIGIVMITFPIFIPIAEAAGFDKLWFVVMCAIMLQSSFLTPPFGYSLIYLKGCAPPEVTTEKIWAGSIPFCLMICLGLLICLVFPTTITWFAGVLVN
ncbi:tripartite transporter large subunit [Desulfosarcina alkanivorans]|uniref:Tripartite transporter large subunit n=1 Tax=Desulfosarcina alkanivorans TaxID=571177 RepID=A0A5K7YMW9_9BACT|nr:TRAP transporter large permease subunit [Desulfosarcina alkanivorans]BBO69725.1 tripartite transporter large subunit [Desulfosarcina alkanivorans]